MYIYVITHPLFKGWTKIGRTVDINKRLDSYQTGCPFRKYKIEFYIKTDHPTIIENHFKENINNNGYEWFICTPEYAIEQIKEQLMLIESKEYIKTFYERKTVKKESTVYFDYIVDNVLFSSVPKLAKYLKYSQKKTYDAVRRLKTTDLIYMGNHKITKTPHINTYYK